MATKRGVTDFLRAFENTGAVFFDLEVDILIELDEQGNVSRVNDAFERELARTQASVVRCELIRLIHEDDLAAFIRSFDTTLEAQPIRLLRRESGTVTVKLIAYTFKRTEMGLRGYLVLRKQ